MNMINFIVGPPPALRPLDGLTDDHPLRPYPNPHRLRTSAWVRAGVFVAVFVVAALLAYSVYLAVTMSRAMSQTAAIVVTELIPAIVAYLVLTLAMEDRVWPHEIAPRRASGLVKGMALSLILISVSVGVLALIGVYRVDGIDWSYSPWSALATIGLTAGIAEEILFRGVLFRLVEEGLGTWGAVAVSALAFGASHLTNPDATWWGALAISLEAGVLFATVYVITRSLWWCLGAHLAWNMAEGPLFGSIVSGTGTTSTWLQARWSGPEILTGGSFGLEASLVPVVIGTGVAVAALVWAHRAGMIVAPAWTRRAKLTGVPADPVPGLPS